MLALLAIYFFTYLFNLSKCQNSVIYCQSIGTWAEWGNPSLFNKILAKLNWFNFNLPLILIN
jgi:hypothetical protein